MAVVIAIVAMLLAAIVFIVTKPSYDESLRDFERMTDAGRP